MIKLKMVSPSLVIIGQKCPECDKETLKIRPHRIRRWMAFRFGLAPPEIYCSHCYAEFNEEKDEAK